MKPLSLRIRSLMRVLAVVAPLLILYAALTHMNVSHQLGRRLDGRMSHELKMLEEAVVRSGGDDARLREIVELMPIDSFPQRRLYGVWADERLILATDHLPFSMMPTVRPGYSTIVADGGEWRVLARALPSSLATGHRHIDLIVADPMSARTALIRGGAIDAALPVLIAAPALIAGIYFALALGLRPLTRLADQIRSRSPDRLQPIATDSVPSEALPIAESVNALLSRLAESIERERRFTADAAHELRTPLTALKAHAQVALRAEDDALRRDALQSIVRTVSRTDRMISQLLDLARLDPQVRQIDVESVSLTRVAAQTVVDLKSRAEGRGQQLRLDGEGDVIVRGSVTALAILTRNVVENATQYSTEGSPIDIRVYRDGDRGVLEVCDSGPGIADAAKQKVFDRFRRLPDAKASGTGLGLSIVQRIAELHDAEVRLDDIEGGSGLKVTVRIPR